MLRRSLPLSRAFARNLRVVQHANFETRNPDEMPRDLFEKAHQNKPPSTKERIEPIFDRRNRYQPQFYEVTEMFLDHVFRTPIKTRSPRIKDWNCVKQQGKVYHWTNSKDKHGITRVKMQTENYERHVEIHWDQWFMLAYQHDAEPKREFDIPKIRPVELLRNKKEAAVIEKMIQKDLPPDDKVMQRAAQMPELSELKNTYTNTIHVGYDIPVEWMMALKSVKWPKSYEPTYVDSIDYFEPFRKSHMLDQFRKFNLYHLRNEPDSDVSHVKNIVTHLRKDSPQRYGQTPLTREERYRMYQDGTYQEYVHKKKPVTKVF